MSKKFFCRGCGKGFTTKQNRDHHETHVDCGKTVRCKQCGKMKKPFDPQHDKECQKQFAHASFQDVEDTTLYQRKITLWCNLCKRTSFYRNWDRHKKSIQHKSAVEKLRRQQQRRKRHQNKRGRMKSNSNDSSEPESEQDSYVFESWIKLCARIIKCFEMVFHHMLYNFD